MPLSAQWSKTLELLELLEAPTVVEAVAMPPSDALRCAMRAQCYASRLTRGNMSPCCYTKHADTLPPTMMTLPHMGGGKLRATSAVPATNMTTKPNTNRIAQ